MDNPTVRPSTCVFCQCAIPDGAIYCPKCGRKLSAETIGSLQDRLSVVEQKLNESKAQQHYLEVDTAEKVVSRVTKWTTLFLYWAIIPTTVILVGLSIFFGESLLDLKSAVGNAKPSVDAVLNQAKHVADDARTTADSALKTSKQADDDIKKTEAAITILKDQVVSRTTETEGLAKQVQASESQVQALNKSVQTSTQSVRQLTDEVTAVKNARTVNEIIGWYPNLGSHFVQGPSGFVESIAREPGTTNLTFSLYQTSPQTKSPFKLNDVAETITTLRNNKFRVFLGFVTVYSGTLGSAVQGTGPPLGQGVATLDRFPPSKPPCILYFREDLKNLRHDRG